MNISNLNLLQSIYYNEKIDKNHVLAYNSTFNENKSFEELKSVVSKRQISTYKIPIKQWSVIDIESDVILAESFSICHFSKFVKIKDGATSEFYKFQKQIFPFYQYSLQGSFDGYPKEGYAFFGNIECKFDLSSIPPKLMQKNVVCSSSGLPKEFKKALKSVKQCSRVVMYSYKSSGAKVLILRNSLIPDNFIT